MDNLHKEFVYLDGKWLKGDDVLTMAKNAGCMATAEHYLCAYLMNAVINGNMDAIAHLNEVRAIYNLKPIPDTDVNGKGGNCNGNDAKADMARKKFKTLTKEKRESLLKAGMKELKDMHANLFKSKIDWNGIFLVVRDRLDESVRKSEFYTLAQKMTPEGWPTDMKIALSTMTNFAHYVEYNDRQEAYYDMENNPWEDLCDRFWEILEELILTSD
jgi:hypothetical protein